MKRIDPRLAVAACIVSMGLGWWMASSPYSPVKPEKDRPVLRLLGKAAKLGLWVMWFAEPTPKKAQEDPHLVHHLHIGDDGYQKIDHGRSF
jgi:hypothetical protein